MVNSMSETFLSRLDALQASIGSSSLPESSSRPSHRPDGGASQPGVTTDESRMFQAMGEPSRKSRKSFSYDQDRPPCQEFPFPSAASQPRDAPRAEPQPSAFVPPPPPRAEVPPQPQRGGALPLRVLPALADCISSAHLPPLAPKAVSALRGVRGRLLLPDLRVSGSGSHHLA